MSKFIINPTLKPNHLIANSVVKMIINDKKFSPIDTVEKITKVSY
jgi:hypothetical protein